MKRIFLLFGTLLFVCSCTSEFDQMNSGSRGGVNRNKAQFYATTESSSSSSSETKVYADEDMKVLWNADDRISIFNLTTYNYQFAFTGDDGDTAGDFEDVTPSGFHTGQDVDYVYAAYPYSKNNKLSNSGVFTMILPAEQSYKEHSFGIGANAMMAVTDGTFLAFKNAGGYLSLRLYGDNISVSRITIKGNNEEKIAGKASINMPFGGTPTVTMDATATDEVSIVCNPAVKIGADANSYTDFWFVIPPVCFSLGFTITVTDDKGGVFERATSKALTINRNTLEWMAALKVVPDYANANVPFEDANFKAYCVKNFDTDHDGEISGEEANAVTEMTVYTETISSLKGMEYFKNLSSLSCGPDCDSIGLSSSGEFVFFRSGEEVVSLLSSLDLSGNTTLTNLEIWGNRLTTLDLSCNPALTYLTCSYNQLTSLNVGNNVALLGIDCSGNQLVSLDVSHNTALAQLLCDSNQLTTLDVSHNTALMQLQCFGNPLTSLDVSHNTALTSLDCAFNQLTSLDVSDNTALTRLYCYSNQLTSLDVSHNTALTYLDCSSNRLTSLDVSHNTALTWLDCHNNQLTSLDVSHNTELTGLSCHSNQLTSLDVSHNTALELLWCDSNRLTCLDVSNNPALTYLDCTDNPSLTEIWLKTGQTITDFQYDTNVATIKYKESDSIQPNNEIWYKTSTEKALTLGPQTVDGLISNTYADGRGTMVFENDVTVIPRYLFEGPSVISVSLPSSVKIIENQAFRDVRITEIEIPKGCICEPGAFQLIPELERIIGDNASDDGRMLVQDGVLIRFANKGISSYEIPEGITAIGVGAFSGCLSLSEITLPSTIEELGGAAFIYCSITSLDLPNRISTIPSNCFNQMSAITSLTLPAQLERIENEAFTNVNLKNGTLTIPARVTYIGNGCVFAPSNRSIDVKVLAPTPPTLIGENAFGKYSIFEYYDYSYPIERGTTIYVPSSSVDIYRADPMWRMYFIDDIGNWPWGEEN